MGVKFVEEDESGTCITGNKKVFFTIHTEEWLINCKGEKRLLLITKTPVFNDNGNVEYIICEEQDITELRKKEEELKKKDIEFQYLVENLNDLISIVDISGVFTYVSSRIYSLLGYNPDEVVGKVLFDFMEEHEAKRVADIFSDIVVCYPLTSAK